jgi:hypothetical protein
MAAVPGWHPRYGHEVRSRGPPQAAQRPLRPHKRRPWKDAEEEKNVDAVDTYPVARTVDAVSTRVRWPERPWAEESRRMNAEQ